MKRLRLLSLVSILFLVNIQIVSAQYVFTAEPFTDELDDGLDFSAAFDGGVIVPLVMPMDTVAVTFTVDKPLDGGTPVLIVSSETTAPPLPHMSYTWEYVIDVDNDPTTGVTEPSSFYNGLGAEYDIGVEVFLGEIAST
ncbi:MAG: hypothetical protein ACERKS_09120, partial [Candidatus Bathyarchaeota archaeon]